MVGKRHAEECGEGCTLLPAVCHYKRTRTDVDSHKHAAPLAANPESAQADRHWQRSARSACVALRHTSP